MLRKFAVNGILVLISLVLSLSAAELVVRYTLFDKVERADGAEKIFEKYDSHYGRKQVTTDDKGCAWSDTNVAHPYLGWVGKAQGKCAQKSLNRRGLYGKEIWLEKDQSKFNILLVGGSVAGHLASGNWHGKIWLEEFLNRDYVSPNGKPFAVYHGAYGGWKFPAQNIAVILFGHGVDAVVAVDGFNEALNNPMDIPDVGLFMRLTGGENEASKLFNFRTFKIWYELCLGNPILRNSYLAAAAHRYLVSQVENAWKEAKTLSPYAQYSFPGGMSDDKRLQWNLQQLKYYIRLLSIESKGLGLKFAHFMQPIPAYLKPLTKFELGQVAYVTSDKYKAMVAANEELAKEGIATFSLADIFQGITEQMYADEIHCKFDEETGENPGYALMSEKMAKVIAKEWKLRRK